MDTDVIVIGAGAAGIAAALELAEHGVRTIVIEGRDRIGGRVMWQTAGTEDVPAELGAEFIHGAAPETSAYMRAAGLTTIQTGGPSWQCDAAGMLHPVDDDEDFSAEDVFARANALSEDESVATFLARFANDPEWSVKARRARAFVEGFEAADPALASVRSIADEINSGTDSESFRAVASYALLFDYLDARCKTAGVEFRLNTTAARVMWKPGTVAIDTRCADGSSATLRASKAIVTVPVGVLRQPAGAVPLAFVPPLPQEKHTALLGLEMGRVVRVVLAFRTPFWETVAGGRFHDAAFFRCDAGAYNAFWTRYPLRSRTIVAWAGGPRTAPLSALSSAGRIERALAEFGTMLGQPDLARREFEGGVTHDWSADPFACGAYSYVSTGGGNARAALAVPIDDTLFFAGEATAAGGQGGTVSGAFGTGQRAAREAQKGAGDA